MSTITCFHREIRKICGYNLLSGAMVRENFLELISNKSVFMNRIDLYFMFTQSSDTSM